LRVASRTPPSRSARRSREIDRTFSGRAKLTARARAGARSRPGAWSAYRKSMKKSCYHHAVSAIQIKNVSEDVHTRLRDRARRQGRSLSEYVRRLIEIDLALPTTEEWLERVKRREPVRGISSERIAELIHEGRRERDEQIRNAAAHH
jgi:antitoxin FitA